MTPDTLQRAAALVGREFHVELIGAAQIARTLSQFVLEAIGLAQAQRTATIVRAEG